LSVQNFKKENPNYKLPTEANVRFNDTKRLRSKKIEKDIPHKEEPERNCNDLVTGWVV
jgi:hypothetical protein